MTMRLSNPLLRLLLFFVLALTVALPTRALAAPALQPTNTAEALLLAYFESDVITTEDAEVVVGLSFYDDDSFELSLNYQDGEAPSVAYGSYVENDTGVVLTIIGADGEDFEETEELELAW